MNQTETRPIDENWTTIAASEEFLVAKDVNVRLAEFSVSNLSDELVPYLAAAAAELDQITAVAAHSPGGEGPVALLRRIARAAITQPHAGGPHTNRLGEQLDQLRGLRDLAGEPKIGD